MSRQLWSEERIKGEISRLSATGCDLTQGRMQAIDSRLTSAAIRYFGSWKAAVEASGVDYTQVAALGKQRRVEKITKWTRETILAELKRLQLEGEDLTSGIVRRKYLSLYATARHKEHFGSWAAALEAAGIDYAAVKAESRARKRQNMDWRTQLIADYEQGAPTPRMKAQREDDRSPSSPPGWARDLAMERLTELHDTHNADTLPQVKRLTSLLRRRKTLDRGQ